MAITYGMSVKEFWEDNPDLFWMYRFSFYSRIKSQQELYNENAWLQGSYFYNAVSVALNNSFSKQKIEYPSQPYGIKPIKEAKKTEINNDILVAKIKGRIAKMQAIKGNETK